MPNWCKGTIKIRGSLDKVKLFLDEGIGCYGGHWEDNHYISDRLERKEWVEDGKDSFGTYYNFKTDEVYVEGTDRAFLNVNGQLLYLNDVMYDGIAVFDFMQAWNVRTSDWIYISRNYGFDVRIFTFEAGGQFCREVEVIDGKVTIDKTIKYKDWRWECPMPEMGG